jgi:hypothetical protein
MTVDPSQALEPFPDTLDKPSQAVDQVEKTLMINQGLVEVVMATYSNAQLPVSQLQLGITNFFSFAVFVVLLAVSVLAAVLLGWENQAVGVTVGVASAVVSALVASAIKVVWQLICCAANRRFPNSGTLVFRNAFFVTKRQSKGRE